MTKFIDINSKLSALFLSLCALNFSLFLTPGYCATPPTPDPTYGLPVPKMQSSSSISSGPSAHWIWSSVVSNNQTVYLRRTFTLPNLPKSAVLSLTADNFFTLYVNGKKLGESYPSSTDADVWQHVQSIDVVSSLHKGENVIVIAGVNTDGPAGVLAQVTVDGKQDLVSDTSWKVAPGDAISADWMSSNFDDSSWSSAADEGVVGAGPWDSNLDEWPGSGGSAVHFAHLALPVSQILDISPGSEKISGLARLAGNKGAVVSVTFADTDDSPSFVVDFGREVAGRVVLVGHSGGNVQVGTGESLAEAINSPWGGLHELTLSPGMLSATPDSAFQYAHIAFGDSSSGVHSVKLGIYLDDKYYPVTYKGSFSCSDPLLTKLWYVGAYTSHLCMQEDIWDAPKRDRARWSGDLNVSGEVINNVFADKFLMEKTLDDLRADAQGGRPYSQPPTGDVNSIPGYSAAYICNLADFHRHIGDYAYLKRHHDELLGLLSLLRSEFDANNLYLNTHNEWSYTDWSPGFDGNTPQSYITTDLFIIRAAKDASFLLGEMGDKKNATATMEWHDQLLSAARTKFPTGATYGDRLQENAMAVYSGTATPDQYQSIYNDVLSTGSSAWDKSGNPPYNNGVISPYYGNYILAALAETGHVADGESLMRSYWGGMIAEGATTFWEAYDPYWPKGDFHANLYADDMHGYKVSLCHGWSSGPTNFLTERVLGIQSTGGGFKSATVCPDLGDLKWAEGSVPTPNGLIHERIDRTATGMAVQLDMPEGILPTLESRGKFTFFKRYFAKKNAKKSGGPTASLAGRVHIRATITF